MSNYLAIATVTAALREILQEAAQAAVSGADVTIQRPEKLGGDGQEKAAINIYLYQVHTNPSWSNIDLPTRDNTGRFMQRPQIALDLDYLFSFHGSDLLLEPQRLLGNALIYLRANPWIRREAIQSAISSNTYLTASNLLAETETVKLSLLPLNLEELSKLWSIFFQIPYTLSVAFRASVVLIEAQEDIPTIQPVKEPRVHVNAEMPSL